MKLPCFSILLALATGLAGVAYSQSPGTAQLLPGTTGSSSEWGSGWLDLTQPTDFHRGDRLRLQLGGDAKKVIVRLLPAGGSPDTSAGVVGDALEVPPKKVIEVVLTEDRTQVIQISVHGGPNPWGSYPLGEDNGRVTVASVTLVRP